MTPDDDLPNETQWFDDNISVTRKGEGDPVQQVLGKKLTDSALVHLCGAPEGSEVTCEVEPWPYDALPSMQQPALVIRAENPKYFGRDAGSHVVVYIQGGQPFLHIEFLGLKSGSAGWGLGTMMFWRIARVCLSLKIRKVTLAAMGGREVPPHRFAGELQPRRWTGYSFWPALGFDGAVPESVTAFAVANFKYYPVGIATRTRVRQFFGSRDDEAFWRLCGDTVSECEFDMVEGSASMAALINRVAMLFGAEDV